MTSEELDFVNSLIGLPYVRGAIGPGEYDCWGLTQAVERRLFNREMPDVREPPSGIRELMDFVRDHPIRQRWRPVATPHHGCVVEMCRNRNPFHIGVYLDVEGGGILHAQHPIGVSWDRKLTLEAAGWRRFVYHEWVG